MFFSDILFRILTWSKRPVIESFLSLTFLKSVFLIFSKVITQAYFLAKCVKNLMYYFVIYDGTDVMNQFYPELCQHSNEPNRFCEPQILTMKEATLYAPVIVLSVLYLPTLIYVSIVSVKKVNKSMKVHDLALLFIFPIFTNMYFIKAANKPEFFTFNSKKPRSQSEPAILVRPTKLRQKPRSKSFTGTGIINKDVNKDQNEPSLSLHHSNVLYVLFFFGALGNLAFEILVQLRMNNVMPDLLKMLIAIFALNILLWVDFNIRMSRRRVKTTLR